MDEAEIAAGKTLLGFLIQSSPDDRLMGSDAIFVCGHNDPRVAAHAAKLYHKKVASKIIVAGGVGPKTELKDGFTSEADYYRHILVNGKVKVPLEDIIVEDQSKSTLDNVQFGMPIAITAIGRQPKKVTVVAMPPLLRRAIATFGKQFPEIQAVGSATPDIPLSMWLTPEKVLRGLGELTRYPVYASKGHILPIEIPPEVQAAADLLRMRFPEKVTV